jgi:hypothetical protein
MVTNGALKLLSEVARWNRLIWAGVYDHVGQADYANSIQ